MAAISLSARLRLIVRCASRWRSTILSLFSTCLRHGDLNAHLVSDTWTAGGEKVLHVVSGKLYILAFVKINLRGRWGKTCRMNESQQEAGLKCNATPSG